MDIYVQLDKGLYFFVSWKYLKKLQLIFWLRLVEANLKRYNVINGDLEIALFIFKEDL